MSYLMNNKAVALVFNVEVITLTCDPSNTITKPMVIGKSTGFDTNIPRIQKIYLTDISNAEKLIEQVRMFSKRISSDNFNFPRYVNNTNVKIIKTSDLLIHPNTVWEYIDDIKPYINEEDW